MFNKVIGNQYINASAEITEPPKAYRVINENDGKIPTQVIKELKQIY